MEEKNKIVILMVLAGLGFLVRLLPHPWNFSPVPGIAIFAAVYLGGRKSLFLPIFILFLSDIFLGFYEWKLMLAVYLSLFLCPLIGFWLKKHKKWQIVVGSSLLCSVSFFFITNLAVWAFTSWYPKSFSGLIQCYLAAMPFFRNTLLGNFFYTVGFFGIYEILIRAREGLQSRREIRV